MSLTTLSEENIAITEAAILSDLLVPEDSYMKPDISYQYYESAENGWKLITNKDIPVTSYVFFASNSNGYISYGFYKAKNDKIYIIYAFLGEIRNIFVPSKNIDCLKNLL